MSSNIFFVHHLLMLYRRFIILVYSANLVPTPTVVSVLSTSMMSITLSWRSPPNIVINNYQVRITITIIATLGGFLRYCCHVTRFIRSDKLNNHILHHYCIKNIQIYVINLFSGNCRIGFKSKFQFFHTVYV